VKRTLKEMDLAIKGLSVMSKELEDLGSSMVQGRVPELWKAAAYASVKPLASWVQDLLDRLVFLQTWIDEKRKPNVFWISGFFFPASFLTGTRQNYARKHAIAIDLLAFSYRVLAPPEIEAAPAAPPADGVHITGLFFQGASWDVARGVVAAAKPRELFAPLPMAHLLPLKTADVDPHQHVYPCPVYKTSERAGLLSTTGHSTNVRRRRAPFAPQRGGATRRAPQSHLPRPHLPPPQYVMTFDCRMDPKDTIKKWTKGGVALFTSLDS
jgi:dynein heavy chain